MDQGPGFDADRHVPPARHAKKVREWVVTALAAVALVTVAVLQRPEGPDPAKLAEARAGITVEPVSVDPLVAIGKAMLWWKWKRTDADPAVMQRIDEMAHTAADKFRAAVVAGEFVDDVAREDRFETLEERLAPESVLRQDIAAVRMMRAGDLGQSPRPDMIEGLKERHGWFARVAMLGQDGAADAALTDETERHGVRVLLVLVGLFGGVVAGVGAGVAALIVLIVRAATGNLRGRFVRTPPEMGSDRALWLETFAVFLVGFLLVHVAGAGLKVVAAPEASWPAAAVLLMQWGLAGVIFWPRLRGMSRERFLGELGWHRGRGVMREMGAGVLGYLAGLPVYFAVAVMVAVVSMLADLVRKAGGQGGEDVPLPDNKVFDLVGHAGGWMLVLLASLIVVWAPLVEESIFRGALFRHIRGRLGGAWGLVASVGIVAAAFAVAHSYVLAGVVMVATLGAMFSLMREWRGSLIAPMTAHCMHNSLVLMVLVSLLPAMRG